MAKGKGEGLWVPCSAQTTACSKSGKAGSAWVAQAGKFKGQVICGGCAKRLKVKRVNLMAATDTVSQRTAMSEQAQVAQVGKDAHKAQYARTLKGGSPAGVVKALGGKAPSVKAPAQAKPEAKTSGRRRPSAKTA